MKWGWKGAFSMLASWVGILLLGLALARAFPPLSGTDWPAELPVDNPLRDVRYWQIGLARPAEGIINTVWFLVGRRIYPRISRSVSGQYGRLPGSWQLYPRVMFVIPPGFGDICGVRPSALPVAVHCFLLPSVAMGVLGFGVGSGLALLKRRFGGSRRGGRSKTSATSQGGKM